jgi:hypothetical protein|tara:strand:+ start:319 stop:2079 length:1761 start_codon:yes stop_codon:yes gene_type:complete
MNYKGNSRFGALPRRTMIANQPHMLAYINPQEEMLLRQLGGAGEPVGPMGIPAYYFGYGGQEQPDANFGYEAPSGGGGGGNQGVSVNDYNNAIARVNQPLERGYNQDARNRDLATIDAYNASFAPVNDPSEIATPTISSPVSIDSGMGAAIDANDGVSDIGLDGGFLGVSDGGSGYVDSGTDVSAGVTGTDFDFGMGSVDGVGDVGTGDIGSGGVDFDSGGDFLGEFGGSGVDIGGGISAGVTGTDFDFGAGSIDGVGSSAGEGDVGITIDPYDNPYAIDITDTNIYTENPDGTYTVEDGEPDPIEIDEPDPIINTGFPENPEEGPPDDFEPPVNQPEPEIDTAEYFNLFRSTAPSSWLRNSIWSAVGTGPDFDVDVYQEADGALRFRETGELVPEEYLKYIPYAKRTEMKAPGEEDEPIVEESVIEPLDDDTVVEPLDDDTVVEPVEEAAVETGTPSSTIITNQASDGSDFTDMTTIVDEPTDYSIDPSIAEATASTLSDRAQGFYDLVSSGNKSLYELNQLSLANNPKSRNPLVRQAAQDAVNEYLYSNLTPDELRAWLDGQFNPITDPTSSVYNPQGIPEGLL